MIVLTLNLTIHNSIATTDNLVRCDSAIWNGNVYDTSGIYIDTLQTVHGCDSIVTMDLTINYSFYAEESITACDSMTWDNGITYTASGIYYDSLQTSNGCDSVFMLDLTINPSPVFSFSQDTVGACGGDSVMLDAGTGYNSYLWNNGATTQRIYASTTGNYSVSVSNGLVNSIPNQQSLLFNGDSTHYVEVQNNNLNEINNEATVEVWLYKNQKAWFEGIISQGPQSSGFEPNYNINLFHPANDINWSTQEGDTERFVFFTASGISAGTFDFRHIFDSVYALPFNEWHHLAITLNNNTKIAKMFVDGLEFTSKDYSNDQGFNLSSLENLYIGCYGLNEGIYSNYGNIDQVRLWNKALSESELQTLVSCPPSGLENDLVGYWALNEGTGTTVSDLSGNGNDGTINGATWSNNTPNQICDNCTTTDSIYVEILDVDIIQNDTNICQGDSLELSVELDPIPSIGDYFEGGYVFHIDSLNGYALIAGDTILGTAEYGCYGQAITGADDSIIGSGLQNTLDIINNCNDQFSAAAICYNSNYNGFSDWYLPSIYELNKVYDSIHQPGIVNYLTTDINNWYWSSTECLSNESNGAQNMIFTSGLVAPCNNKNSNMGGVIPVSTYNFATNNNLITWSSGETTETIYIDPTQSTTYYVTASNGINSCQDSVGKCSSNF